MKLTDDDWHYESSSEDTITLELVKKEYASWLSVSHHPEHNIWGYCADNRDMQKIL